MAHDSDGRIYVDPNNTGVSIADLQSVLGRGTGDLGLLCSDKEWNAAGTALVSVNKTNKFSKFKPFRNSAIGFAFDRTKATPELRSPERLAQALLANYGLTIPKFNASNFKTHYSDPWVYDPPRGRNGGGSGVHEWFRLLDFDGYQHSMWQVGPVLDRGIYTIFNGYMGVPNATVFAGDTIQLSIQCADDGESGIEGLLYPYDFYRDTQSNDDLSKYYLGIALLDSQSRLWVITGDKMDSHHTLYDVSSSLVKTIPTNLADGAFKAIPMLASYQYPNWDSAPGMGLFVSLNGQYLSLTKSSSSRILQITVGVLFVNSGVTLNISMRNQSANAVTISYLYGFYMSRAAESNEHDDGYPAPDYVDPGVYGFIDSNWPSASLDPSSGFPLNDGPNIHVDDWAPNEGHYLAARAYSACYADFRSANNNSTTIASGATVSWSKRFNGVTEDDFGSYAEYMRYVMCVRIGTTAYIDIFIADE